MASSPATLWQSLTVGGKTPAGTFHGVDRAVALASLTSSSFIDGRLADLRGRSVLISSREQLPAALALVELDGIARRVVLCTPDMAPEHYASVIADAGTDVLLSDGTTPTAAVRGAREWRVGTQPMPLTGDRSASVATEWILFTSGTTGQPKLVLHTLASLVGQAGASAGPARSAVWSTFYDIRRYGGLQIFLRAVLGGASLVFSSASESVSNFLSRAGARAVSHISGTPSHWRRALMSGAAQSIAPRYVRLSGEIADQPILDALRATYPQAELVHAFASTEAGVAFDVVDATAGFPAELLGRSAAGVDLKVEEGTLRIRSSRTATRYLGGETAIVGPDGYVDTGDLVELRHGRYYFVGRRGGIINVGGLKVHPEEVEAVINAHPAVRMSLVRARRNSITGAVVVADVVLARDADGDRAASGDDGLVEEIVAACRKKLPAHKVPAMIRFVNTLEVSDSGKLVRPGA